MWPGSLGGAVSSPQWGRGAKPQEVLAILHSEIGQNIAVVALPQQTVTICLFLE